VRARHLEHARSLEGFEQLHVSRVHVDRRPQPGLHGALDVEGEALPVDAPVLQEGQQDRRRAEDATARANAGEQIGQGGGGRQASAYQVRGWRSFRLNPGRDTRVRATLREIHH
jgi:hypothetical protein